MAVSGESPSGASSWNPEGWPVDGPALLLLVTRGFEDLALSVLLRGGGSGGPAELSAELPAEPSQPSLAGRLSALPLPTKFSSSPQSGNDVGGGPLALTPPRNETGEASVGKLLLRLDGLNQEDRAFLLSRVLRSPVLQGVMAFVAAGTTVDGEGCREGKGKATVFQGGLAQIADLISNAPRWASARAIFEEVTAYQNGMSTDSPAEKLAGGDQKCEERKADESSTCDEEPANSSKNASPVAAESGVASDVHAGEQKEQQLGQTLFRASCIRDGICHKGFKSQDVMAAMGSGAWAANPDWGISFKEYDVELLGFFHEDLFACGLWLGGKWCKSQWHFNIVPVGDKRPYLAHGVSYLPRLRPSTGLLMAMLAAPQPGEALIDPFGGVGTVAIEAACRFPGLACISSDKDTSAHNTASQHCGLARKLSSLQSGSSARSRHWDARKLKLQSDSIDMVVSDLPFLNKCTFKDSDGASAREVLAATFDELARVLRVKRVGGGHGLAILLVQSRKLLLDALALHTGRGKTGNEEETLPQSCKAKTLELASTLPRGFGDCNPRTVVIGGFSCWIFALHCMETPVLQAESSQEQSSS
eukprot:TRINITY_DN26826_c0_g4_i1.p1 TRINITY_DN26826_c0_g4~~TRINITY_DN26826_c0_g4_i1.p1  ORF type:complete len:606 (+),score=76.09 TRINITY_DN26826_c0_g4_i1:52-1818(+)